MVKVLLLAPNQHFTPEEEQGYQRWFENNFDITDLHYLLWLKDQHHDCFLELPSSNEPTLAAENLEFDSGINDPSTTTPAQVEMSNSHISNVAPCTNEMSVADVAFTLDEEKML